MCNNVFTREHDNVMAERQKLPTCFKHEGIPVEITFEMFSSGVSRFDGEADFVGDGFYFSSGEGAHSVCEADEE